MMTDSSPPVSPPSRRHKRRWLRRLLWWVGLVLLLLWVVKVPLLNWGLRRLEGDFEVSITGVSPGFAGATLSGVKVIHRPTGRLLAYAATVEVANGWTRMCKGELGTLAVLQAEVNWRPEFWSPENIPLVFGPPSSPLLTWETGEARESVFSWYERGQEVPRLSMKVTHVKGGRVTIYNDGRMEATEQAAVLDELVSREYVMNGSFEIQTRSPHAEGIMTARRRDNRYTAETLKLSAPELNMVWRRGESLPAALPEVPEPPRPPWDRPAEFFIKDGITEPGRVMFTIHSPRAAPVECAGAITRVHTAGLRAGAGTTCTIALAEADFTGLKSPGATVGAREFSFVASLDDLKKIHVVSAGVKGATVSDSNRLLGSLGFTPEETKSLPVCRTGLDAKCGNLLIGSHGITSADPQLIVLENFSAIMPGKKEPVAKVPRVELSAVPDEAVAGKRLRSVVVEKPELKVDRSELPSVAREHKQETGTSNNPSRWHTDSLTVHEGRGTLSGLGFGAPNVTSVFTVRTEPREPSGDSIYRIHLSDITLAIPVLPIKSKGVMDVDVHPLRFWETGEADQIFIDGEKVQREEVFQKLFKSAGNAAPKPEAPAPAAAREAPSSLRSGTS